MYKLLFGPSLLKCCCDFLKLLFVAAAENAENYFQDD